MAEHVDVELVRDVQDQLHELVVALEDLQFGLPRSYKHTKSELCRAGCYLRSSTSISSNHQKTTEIITVFDIYLVTEMGKDHDL